MTVNDIKELVESIDPEARHYFLAKDGKNFTVWMETELIPGEADDEYEEGWAFEISRFTKLENDEMAARIKHALDTSDRIISYTYKVMGSPLGGGYIQHSFACEAI